MFEKIYREDPMTLHRTWIAWIVVAAALALAMPAQAASVNAAVAANFTAAAEELGAAFKVKTGDDVVFSFGSTGQLYSQITQAAPFALFFSADNKRTAQAVSEGFGVEGTVFTYAIGALALYSPSLDLADGEAVLRAGAFTKIAIADPATAPYGQAAMETMGSLGLTEALTPKVVTGTNIAQTLQFVDSGNAELGFVAAAQVVGKPAWLVPEALHEPILQDAVLLKAGQGNPVAQAFLDFVKSDEGTTIIEKYGYVVPAAN
jgi:molybdate transport system substrate-binding protein